MSTDAPMIYQQYEDTLRENDSLRSDVARLVASLSAEVTESARLREEVEMLNVRHAAAMLHAQTHADEYNALREDVNGLLQDIQRLTEEAFKRDEELSLANGTIESRDRNIATLQEELAEAKRDVELAELVIQQKQEQIASAEAALEQAEARALEYKTEHAALLGTSQWQETEIADLRDDVKRHMQIASECEERALANEKDAGRFRWLLEDHEHPATRELRNSLLNRMQVMSYSAACTDIDAAIGAKHD